MFLAALALSACVVTSAGAAPTPAAKKEAGAHFQKGVGLYKEGDYASALAEFKAAHAAVPGFEVLYNIGLTERRLFKYGQAVRSLNAYLAQGGAKVPKDRRDSVQKELEQISALTSAVTVVVEGAPAQVSADGEAVGTSPLGEPLLLGPGHHVVRAERSGGESAEATLELASGSTQTVTLTPKPADLERPVAVSIDSTPPGASLTVDGTPAGPAPVKLSLGPGGHEVLASLAGHNTARTEFIVSPGQARAVTVALVSAAPSVVSRASASRGFPLVATLLGAVGLVGLGAAAMFDQQAQASAKKVSGLFSTGGTWDSSWSTLEAAGQRSQTLSVAGLVVGGVGVLSGVVALVVWFVSGAPDAAPAVTLTPAPGGASWLVRF